MTTRRRKRHNPEQIVHSRRANCRRIARWLTLVAHFGAEFTSVARGERRKASAQAQWKRATA